MLAIFCFNYTYVNWSASLGLTASWITGFQFPTGVCRSGVLVNGVLSRGVLSKGVFGSGVFRSGVLGAVSSKRSIIVSGCWWGAWKSTGGPLGALMLGIGGYTGMDIRGRGRVIGACGRTQTRLGWGFFFCFFFFGFFPILKILNHYC